MKNLIKWSFGLSLALLLFTSCDDNGNDCPAGMHEQTLQDGSTICVPD